MNHRLKKQFIVLHSNIQGFTRKKESIKEILQRSNCDVCLLTETMTTNVKLHGMKCITPKKTVGQNVAIILRNQSAGLVPMILYEPYDTINMMGVRLELAKNNFKRFYTAHMKQISTKEKEAITNQFESYSLTWQMEVVNKVCSWYVM